MARPIEVLAQLLSPAQAEVLGEVGANSWESVRRVLGVIMDAPPEIANIESRLVMPDEISTEFGEPHLVAPIQLSTAHEQTATAWVVFPTAGIVAFLDVQTGDPTDAEQQAIVVGSTILEQVVGSLNAQVFAESLNGLVLELESVTADSMPHILSQQDEPCLWLGIDLAAEGDLKIIFLLPGTFLDIMAAAFPEPEVKPEGEAANGDEGERANPFGDTFDELEPAAPAAEVLGQRQTRQPAMASLSGDSGAGLRGGGWAAESGPARNAPLGGIPAREPTPISTAPTAQRARFAPLPEPEPTMSRGSLDLLSMLEMNVSVELGRTQLTVAEVLALGPGSVIELERLAGEPVDILVNDRLVARGEVVVVDENFGVRVVEVVRRGPANEERAV